MITIKSTKLGQQVQVKPGNYFYKEDSNGVYRLGVISFVFDSGAFTVKFAGAMQVNQFPHEHGKHLWGPKGGQKAMDKTWKASVNKTIKKNTAGKKVPAAGKKATAEGGEEKATADKAAGEEEGGEAEEATAEGESAVEEPTAEGVAATPMDTGVFDDLDDLTILDEEEGEEGKGEGEEEGEAAVEEPTAEDVAATPMDTDEKEDGEEEGEEEGEEGEEEGGEGEEGEEGPDGEEEDSED